MPLDELNKTHDGNLSFNKWEFLYNYSIKALDQDIDRFHKIDEKITKFIAIITILISAFFAFMPYLSSVCFPPGNFLEVSLIFSSTITFVCLCSVWIFLFRGLKIQDVPRMPFDRKLLDFFINSKDDFEIYTELTKVCFETFNFHQDVNSRKIEYLINAYHHTKYAAILILIDIIFITILKLIE